MEGTLRCILPESESTREIFYFVNKVCYPLGIPSVMVEWFEYDENKWNESIWLLKDTANDVHVQDKEKPMFKIDYKVEYVEKERM